MKSYAIASVCPSPSWGGLEMNVYKLNKWLIERGWRVINYAMENTPLWDACANDNLPLIPLNSTGKWDDFKQSGAFARSLVGNNCRFGVLHLNRNFPLMALAKRRSKNFFTFIYEQHMHIGPEKKDFLHNWVYSHLDLWLATVPMLADQVVEKTNIPREKIKVVHRGIEVSRFVENQPSQIEARKYLNLPAEVTIVGVLGRIDPKKGQHLLIEAAASIHKTGYPIHLLIAGGNSLNEETGYDTRLRELTKQLNLTEYVHFRGHQEKQEYALAAMDISAMTTPSETYGTVTVEAMASGLPVVGSNDGGTIDLVTHNETGLLFESSNSQALADALLELLHHPEKIKEMGTAGRNIAVTQYSNTRQCELWEDIFNSYDYE